MTQQLTELITTVVNSLDYELVDFECSARGMLRVFIDFADPSDSSTGETASRITLEDCEKVSNQLHYVLGAENIDYQRLEVSSPGLDRPLKKLADFARFSGREAVVMLKKPFAGRKQYQGILQFLQLQPGETMIRLEFANKEGPAVLNFTLADIDKARLVPQVDFRRENES